MRIGDEIDIKVFWDDSGTAEELYGVEPQCSWFEVIVFTDTIKAVVTKVKGVKLARHVRKYDNEAGRIFDISKCGIEDRIDSLKNTLECYGKDFDTWLAEEKDNDGIQSLDEFYVITPYP